MYKAHKFRLYPDDAQRILINKTFGCARFIYNYFLDKCMKNGFIKVFDMCSEIKDLVVTSDGEKYNNPKEIEKREKRLKRLQRKLSRQVKESNNYYKTIVKIVRLHNRIKNSRKHNLISVVN